MRVNVTGISDRPDEQIFSNERGTWNVSKALRHCKNGVHGRPFLMDTGPAIEANKAVDVDHAKIEQLKRVAPRDWTVQPFIATPLVMIMEEGAAWLIDGHHRLRAMHQLGWPTFAAWVIEEQYEPHYRVLFNGLRHLPNRKSPHEL